MGTLIFASLTVFHFIRVTSVTDLIHYSWTPHPEATHDERSWYKSKIHGIYMVSVIKWKFFWAQNDALTDKFISVKYFLTFHLLQLLWISCTTNLEVFRNKMHQKMVSNVEKQPKIVCLIFINIFFLNMYTTAKLEASKISISFKIKIENSSQKTFPFNK